MKKTTLIFLLSSLFFTSPVFCQVLSPTIDSIPMRDGKKLAADVYIPFGCTQCPTILIQTPYSKFRYRFGLPLGIGTNFNSSNYIFVIADWRGFYGSNAADYAGSPTRGQDGYDCVQWIAQQSWSNGKVGAWGPSALGNVQFMTAKENPPNLTCIAPLVAGPQYNYLEYFPGGVYRTEYVEQMDALGFGTSQILLANPVYNNLWTFVEAQNFYPNSIKVPTFMIGGWYDHNIEKMLLFFNAIRSQSPVNVRDKHRLLMGPWVHGGSGPAQVGSAQQGQLTYNNATGWNDSLALMFFDYHLRNISNAWDLTPYLQYYQMGDDAWQTSVAWPPAGLTNYNLYFHPDTSMDLTVPSSSSTSFLSFNYDPNNPSPTIGGPTLRSDLDQGPYDQDSAVESRNDILKFTTAILSQDMVMKGNAKVHLSISSNRKDTDFSVRLTDVYPDGRSMLVNDGISRMRFRNGYTANDTAVMTLNQMYACDIDLPATCITFKAGHRIRADVTSSNYPRFNRNANNGGGMYPGNNGDSLLNPVIALTKIYMDDIANNSYITMPLNSSPFLEISETLNNEITIDVYPNPTSGKANVLISQFENLKMNSIEVYNVYGEKIYLAANFQINSFSNFQIDLSGQPRGIYFLKLKSENRVVRMKKIVVM